MDALGNDEVFVDTIMVGPWVHLGKLETTSCCCSFLRACCLLQGFHKGSFKGSCSGSCN